jgi:hypothetical protein
MNKVAIYWKQNRKWIVSAAVGVAGSLTYILGPSNKYVIIITAVLTSFGVWGVPNERAAPATLKLSASEPEDQPPPGRHRGAANAG